ncbi:MAG: hypothetical protein WC551_13835 [Patescibacteria group bacterium]
MKSCIERRSERALAEVSERKWQDSIVGIATDRGYLVYHVARSDRAKCAEGFPDLVIAGHHRLVIAELKTVSGQLDPNQAKWRRELERIENYDYQVWRPGQLEAVNLLLPASKE